MVTRFNLNTVVQKTLVVALVPMIPKYPARVFRPNDAFVWAPVERQRTLIERLVWASYGGGWVKGFARDVIMAVLTALFILLFWSFLFLF